MKLSWGVHGPSWGQHLGQLEPTWGALDRLESVGLVLGPFWLGFWCIWVPFWLHFGSVFGSYWVRSFRFRFVLMPLQFRFLFHFHIQGNPPIPAVTATQELHSDQGDPKLTAVRSVVRSVRFHADHCLQLVFAASVQTTIYNSLLQFPCRPLFATSFYNFDASPYL